MIRILASISAFAMVAFGSAMAFEQQALFVPPSGIEGSAEIRIEEGVFCRDKSSAEKLLSANAAVKPKFAHGSVAGLTANAVTEDELECKLDVFTVAGVFPKGKLSVPVIVPVRLIESRGPEFRWLVMK